MTHTAELVLRYTPRGSARDLFTMQEREIVLSGPAGTGKSRSILEKIHFACLSHPGLRAAMLRKTRRSLTESGMVTYWQKVRPALDRVQWKTSQQQYQYPNGSILAVGGLDKASKFLSSEWDIIYCQEATELTENDWESLTTRLRNGKNSYHQLIGDCNPDAPTHWLRIRANMGRTLMLESRHEDNPLLFDETGQMTPEGVRYISTLESLTGVRLARYRYGLWAASEGMVYENSWDRARNVIDPFPIPKDWGRFLSVDFGFTHAFVCQWYAVDGDGRLYLYRELYKTQALVEDHAIAIALASGWYHLLPSSHPKYRSTPTDWADPLPRAIICDHDAEGRAVLEKYLKLYTTPAKKSVSDGIQAVASRFKPAGDGRPRLFLMRDSLIERDPDLAQRKKPTCTEEEVEGYTWLMGSSGVKEEPVKIDDHGVDAMRYCCAYHDLGPNTVSYYGNLWR